MRQILHFLMLLLWKYFPIIRPSNIKISGLLTINLKTRIVLSINSELNVDGNADLSNSNINIENSKLHCGTIVCNDVNIYFKDASITIGQKSHLKQSDIKIFNSNVKIGEHFRAHNSIWNISSSETKIGNYFLSSGDPKSYFSIENSSFNCDNNVRIQANININNGSLDIGSNSFVNSGCKVSCINHIKIGNYVMISYDCFIFDNNSHSLDFRLRREEIDAGFPNGTLQKNIESIESKPVVINNDVWIGAKAMVMKGVNIGSGSIVAAATIVTKNVPETSMVYGFPNKYNKLH